VTFYRWLNKEKVLKLLGVFKMNMDYYICKSLLKLLSERGIAKRYFIHFKYCLIYCSKACIIYRSYQKYSCASFRFLHQQESGRKEKTPNLQMGTVEEIVNFIASRALNSWPCKVVLRKINPQYSITILGWLSCVHVLCNFVEYLPEVHFTEVGLRNYLQI